MRNPAAATPAGKAWPPPTHLSISCAFTFDWPIVGVGSPMGSSNMSAAWWPKSADYWAAGSVKPKNNLGAAGTNPDGASLLYWPNAQIAACGRDEPAPSNNPPPHLVSLSRRDKSAEWRAKVDVGTTHYPKTDVVVPVVRVIVVAVAGARVVFLIVPRAATQRPRPGFRTPHRSPGYPRIPGP